MEPLAAEMLAQLVEASSEAVLVCELGARDWPVVYVNPAYERQTGYRLEQLRGQPAQILQGVDADQDGVRRLREAVARGVDCRVTLRNLRQDGTTLWSELTLRPLRGASGAVTHYAVYLRDAGDGQRTVERPPAATAPNWLREDRVTGLATRPWFEECYLREWAIARRDARNLSLLLFDVDGLARYTDTFGRSAADAALRRISRVIGNGFRRGTDLVGRWSNSSVGVITGSLEPHGTEDYARLMAQRIAELHIHNPHSTTQRYLTVSVGLAALVPEKPMLDSGVLVRAAEAALIRAQAGGGGCVAVAAAEELLWPAQGAS